MEMGQDKTGMEMGMLTWECERIGTNNSFVLTSISVFDYDQNVNT